MNNLPLLAGVGMGEEAGVPQSARVGGRSRIPLLMNNLRLLADTGLGEEAQSLPLVDS